MKIDYEGTCSITGRDNCVWCERDVMHSIDVQDFSKDAKHVLRAVISDGDKPIPKGMYNFLERGRTFNRNRIVVVDDHLDIHTNTVQRGYAWIGLAHHNTDHGCKAVDTLNYMLIQPTYISVYFKTAHIGATKEVTDE